MNGIFKRSWIFRLKFKSFLRKKNRVKNSITMMKNIFKLIFNQNTLFQRTFGIRINLNHSFFFSVHSFNSIQFNGEPLELTMQKEIDFELNSSVKYLSSGIRYAWTIFYCVQSVARSFGYDNYSQTKDYSFVCHGHIYFYRNGWKSILK